MAGWEERFDDYVERLGETLGHADRRGPLRAYATGLLLPGERKSVEPMAARVDPARVSVRPRSIPVGSTTTTCSGRRSNGARSSPATARGSSVMDHLPCGITS